MIEFFNKLFGRQASGATAKERLRLVLMSDHLSLSPEMVEAMKADLVDVISRYVEVDREKIDIHFEHEDKALAMMANIPITGVNRNGDGGGKKKAEDPALALPATAQTAAPQLTTPAANAQTGQKRGPRRRKKPSAGGGGQSGAPAPAT